MIDTFHEDQLSVRPLGMGLILKRPTQLLNGNVSFQDLVKSRAGKQENPGKMWSAKSMNPNLLMC